MKITSLVENTCNSDNFPTEHGLSLYIETNGIKILFDMGQTNLFSKNAKKLGIDLSEIDFAILSHGHYDHGGGLGYFLDHNTKAPVYISRFAFEPHYNGSDKYIGLDTSIENSDRIIFTDGKTYLGNKIHLYSPKFPSKRFPMEDTGLSMIQNGNLVPDDFCHEQYLLVEENGKRILFSGCSHKGIADIVKYFEPDILIGGFHFSKLPLDDTLKSCAKYLNDFDTKYYTCHCTGIIQYEFLSKYINKLHYLSTGESIEI